MPNLVGVWATRLSEELIRQTLAAQLNRVRVPGVPYREYVSTHPGFGMALMDHGILENGEQPAESEDGRTALLLDGEINNSEELQKRFRDELPAGRLRLPELCLRLLSRHGPEVVRLFNGLFCLVVYDRQRKQVTLISDRYGFRPLYYVSRPGTFLFGSELKALCVADPNARKIDEIGTLELFCYGTHVMERTSVEGYARLAPATILALHDSGLTQRRYWTYQYDENAPTLDQQTYFTVCGTLLDRAVERCMRGSHRIGIFLSGGYDSRSVAASIRKHHQPIPAFTFGAPESRDVRFATLLSERLGLEHIPLTASEPYLYPHCRSIVWRTEGMISFANTTSIRHHARMKQKMDVILTGFLAEFGGSHAWPRLLLARSRSQAIQAIFHRMLSSRLAIARRVFQPAFFERCFEAVRARFQESFAQVENEHPLNIADSWNLIHLQPRSTYHAPSIDRHLFEMRAPHMDAEFVDFLLTIPPYSRLEQRVYKKMIAYRFPEIRDVPCTNSGLPINPHFAREYATMTLRYLGRRAAAPFKKLFLPREPLGREFRDLSEDFRAEPELMDQILRPLLEAEIFPPELFNRSGIEQIVREHYEQNARHESILSLLISWGLGVKYFLRDDLSDVPAELWAG